MPGTIHTTSIRCGSCHGRHASVEAVAACYEIARTERDDLPRSWYDLPLARWAWGEDARESLVDL